MSGLDREQRRQAFILVRAGLQVGLSKSHQGKSLSRSTMWLPRIKRCQEQGCFSTLLILQMRSSVRRLVFVVEMLRGKVNADWIDDTICLGHELQVRPPLHPYEQAYRRHDARGSGASGSSYTQGRSSTGYGDGSTSINQPGHKGAAIIRVPADLAAGVDPTTYNDVTVRSVVKEKAKEAVKSEIKSRRKEEINMSKARRVAKILDGELKSDELTLKDGSDTIKTQKDANQELLSRVEDIESGAVKSHDHPDYAASDHVHSGSEHEHDATYADKRHRHDTDYATAGHSHDSKYELLTHATSEHERLDDLIADHTGTEHNYLPLAGGDMDTSAQINWPANTGVIDGLDEAALLSLLSVRRSLMLPCWVVTTTWRRLRRTRTPLRRRFRIVRMLML